MKQRLAQTVYELLLRKSPLVAARFVEDFKVIDYHSSESTIVHDLNTYWRKQFTRFEALTNRSTLNVRAQLGDTTDADLWLAGFTKIVVPVIVRFNLPMPEVLRG